MACCIAGSVCSGKPRLDFLQQPPIAVRIAECGEGAVAGLLGRASSCAGIRTACLELSSWLRRMEHFRDRRAFRDQALSRRINIRHDDVEVVDRARHSRRDLGAELNGALRSGRRELNDAESLSMAKSASSRQPKLA
jgi:hypothetical protein